MRQRFNRRNLRKTTRYLLADLLVSSLLPPDSRHVIPSAAQAQEAVHYDGGSLLEGKVTSEQVQQTSSCQLLPDQPLPTFMRQHAWHTVTKGNALQAA